MLYIAPVDFKYGAQKSLYTLMTTLKRDYGVTPVLLTKKQGGLNELCDEQGIENHSFWHRDILAGGHYNFFLLTFCKHAVKFFFFLLGAVSRKFVGFSKIDFSSIDLIHTNNSRNDIGVYLRKKYNIPHIWHIRELGEEDYNVVMYKRNCINYMNDNADHFIAISDVVKNSWVKKGISSNKITRVYNGISPELFYPRIESTDNILKLVICGRIQPNKCQLQLIDAIALLSTDVRVGVHVDILGDGYADYEAVLRSRVKDLGLEKHVKFVGYKDNISKLLAEYDVGVMCSKAEAFGRVTVEYMFAGLTVIASDTGANPEIIDNMQDGMLYSWGDTKCLAEKITKVYRNREFANQLADAGRVKAEALFTDNVYAKAVYEIYCRLLNGTKAE